VNVNKRQKAQTFFLLMIFEMEARVGRFIFRAMEIDERAIMILFITSYLSLLL
jgi:hypothetical protein